MFHIITENKRQYGGEKYEEMVKEALSRFFDVEIFPIYLQKSILKGHRIKPLGQIFRIRGQKDIWIRSESEVIATNKFFQKGKEIAIIHHHDSSVLAHPLLTKLLEFIFLKRLRKKDVIVVVSDYWKEYFEQKGFKNVVIIHNCFKMEDFSFSDEEVKRFKRKFLKTEKPIVYLGNNRKDKGILDAYNALKDKNYYLVASGKGGLNIPLSQVHLNYHEYLLLLKSSSVVLTLSKFKEGWCRTAHEALLCKTPVIGTGTGGMQELLEGGGQLICKDVSELNRLVECSIKNNKSLGKQGYEYARKFTFGRFCKQWKELVEKTACEKFS